jgi:hypothetical protein
MTFNTPASANTEDDLMDSVSSSIQQNSTQKLRIDPTVAVDLNNLVEFTDEHLQAYKKFMDWESNYPELYKDLPEAIIFVGFDLGQYSKVDLNTQKYREGGRAKNKKEIVALHGDLQDGGFKYRHPVPSWFIWKDETQEIITGVTRGEEVHLEFKIPNQIVGFYRVNIKAEEARKKPFTRAEIEDALEICGLKFNAIHDPANPVSMLDVIRIVKGMVHRYIDTNGEAGIPKTLPDIMNRVDKCSGKTRFTPQKRLGMAYEVYNNFNPNMTIMSWSGKPGDKTIESKMKEWKLVDTDKVKYIVTDCQMLNYTFVKATAMSTKNPEAEIRIMLHTGTLSGFDHHKCFKDRISKFILGFDVMIENVCSAFYGEYDSAKKETTIKDKVKNNIKIYGAFYALEEFHDFLKPLLINERTTSVYQKSNGYTFDYLNPDGNGMLDLEEDEDGQEIT